MFAYHTIQPQSLRIKKNKKKSVESTISPISSVPISQPLPIIDNFSEQESKSTVKSISPDVSVSVSAFPPPVQEPQEVQKIKVGRKKKPECMDSPVSGNVYKLATTKIYSNKVPQCFPAEFTFLTSVVVRNLEINTGFSYNEIIVPLTLPENCSNKSVISACNGNVEINADFHVLSVSKVSNNQIKLVYLNNGAITKGIVNISFAN